MKVLRPVIAIINIAYGPFITGARPSIKGLSVPYFHVDDIYLPYLICGSEQLFCGKLVGKDEMGLILRVIFVAVERVTKQMRLFDR